MAGMQQDCRNNPCRVVVLPRPLFPTRFYLLHPWSRALLSVAAPGATLPPPSLESYLPTLTAREGGNAKGLSGTILAIESSASDHQAIDRDVGRYDSREGGGRVAPGAATENNASDLQGRRKLEQRRSSCRSNCRDGGNAEGLFGRSSASMRPRH